MAKCIRSRPLDREWAERVRAEREWAERVRAEREWAERVRAEREWAEGVRTEREWAEGVRTVERVRTERVRAMNWGGAQGLRLPRHMRKQAG